MKSITLLLALVGATFSFAQTKYDLSDYKLADLERHQLDFDFLISGQNVRTNNVYGENERNFKSNTISTDIIFRHAYFKNTRKFQGNYNGNLNYRFYRNAIDTATYVNNDVFLSYKLENRFYVKPNLFIAFNPSIDMDYLFSKQENNFPEHRSEEARAFVELPVGIGYGRIERVEDYRMALYLQETLRKNGQLSESFTQEQLLELAAEISRLKNRRFYDFRLQRIYEIESLDSMLTTFGLPADKSGAFYAHLLDYWNFANNPIRESGFRASLKYNYRIATTGSTYKTVDSTGETESSRSSYFSHSGGPVAEFYYAIPISINWQFTSGLSSEVGFGDYNEEGVRFESFNELFARLGYYPNSRSYLELYANTGFNYRDQSVNSDQSGGGVNFYYYFSPQLRLNLRYSIMTSGYVIKDNLFRNEHRDVYQTFNARLTYMIF